MTEEKSINQELPKTIKLKDVAVTCPKCKAQILIDLDLDVSFISDFMRKK